MRTATALVVHGDAQLGAVIEFALETYGFTVHIARDADSAAARLAAEPSVALVVVDLTGVATGAATDRAMDTAALCARIRRDTDAAILALVTDPAPQPGPAIDDRLGIPFHPRELAVRARALVARTEPGRPGDELHVGRLRIQCTVHRVSFAGQLIELPFTELRLLAHLATHRGVPQSWRTLLQSVWGTDQLVGGRDVVKSAVYRLRGRLGAAGGDPGYVRTLRGAGYVMPDLPPDLEAGPDAG